ncbi:MAG: hypothetical protein NVS2B12_42840 [Ktedonobacteraceae bacterium]
MLWLIAVGECATVVMPGRWWGVLLSLQWSRTYEPLKPCLPMQMLKSSKFVAWEYASLGHLTLLHGGRS